jgi:hypothetical protein
VSHEAVVENKMDSAGVIEFGRWFSEHADQLRKLPASTAVDLIHSRLQAINQRLGVEVSDDNVPREIVVSAGREPSLFGLVELICDTMRNTGWKVQALKPARGFGFKIKSGGIEINADTLLFEPLQSASRPHEVGIKLYAPHNLVEAAVSGAAWWIIETGIGERAASGISHVEVASLPPDLSEPIPIRDLGAFLEWRARKQQARS